MIKAGEQIMDAEGNLYATVAKGIKPGDRVTVQQFIFAGDAPKGGDRVPAILVNWFRSKGSPIIMRMG